ncbi:hypothetical protein KAI46_05230 [bacterium]|nr:hypothetical protein [bacterium]
MRVDCLKRFNLITEKQVDQFIDDFLNFVIVMAVISGTALIIINTYRCLS